MSQLNTVDVEIVASSDGTLPPSSVVQLSLLDISLSDAPAVSVAELRLRCAGVMPIRLSLSYDAAQLVQTHHYVLSASIEQAGRLIYTNMTHHPFDPLAASGKQQLTVDSIEAT